MARAVSAVPLLAKRFLLSRASDRFISLITWVSVLGIALGVLALTVVTGAVNGFEKELSRVITGMNGDVVFYSRGEPIQEPEVIRARLKKIVPEIQSMTPSFVTEVMAAGPNGVAGAAIEGIDIDTIGEVTALPQRLIDGKLPVLDSEIALGSALADRLGARIGSEIRVIIPFGESRKGENAENVPSVFKGTVVGIVKMGHYDYDSKFIFVSLGWVQKLLKQEGKVTSFKLKLKPGTDSAAISDRLADNFGFPFRAKDWAQLNKNFFYAIKLEKTVIAIILSCIVLVAAFNVISTLMMMIHDKTKEIAILKAMGFKPSQSFGLFCLIGVGMGVVGTFFGVGFGVGINWILGKTHFINLPADIYYIGFLPIVTEWREVGMIAAAALGISLTATLYPAWKVSRRPPLEGIRYE